MKKLYDIVTLIKQANGINVPIGAIGSVLMIHDVEPVAYEVEFFSFEKNYLGVFTVTDDQIARHIKRYSKRLKE
jgi:hypothetical protein